MAKTVYEQDIETTALSTRLMLRGVGWPLAWITFFSCFLNVSYLAAPLYMMQVYDRVMRSHSVPTLLYLTLAVTIAYVVFAVLDNVRGQILGSVSDVVENTLSSRLLYRATTPLQHGCARPGPAHLGRDLDTVRQFAAGSAILSFIDLPWAPLYLCVLFLLHWALGAFTIGACVILLALTIVSERAVRGPMARAGVVAERAYRFGDAVARYADCASTMGLSIGLTRHWRRLRLEMLHAQGLATQRAVILGSTAKFFRMFTQSGVLGLGAYLAIQHQISGGAIFAGSLLLGRCLAPIEGVIASWRATVAAHEAFARIRKVAGSPQSSGMVLPLATGEVSLEQVNWTPAGNDRPVLTDVTLRIESGAVLVVVGSNAAGKSTLGRLISGALRPDHGLIRLDGSEYEAWDTGQLGRAIGYLPQDASLFPGTIRDNIARFGDASDAEIIAAARASLAHEMILRLPLGYQTRVADGDGGLSGGQRQRIALARAMLFDPPLLVLDEPNASLDADGEAALLRCVIAARERHRTVVLITHNMALVRLADYVATMVGGRIVRIQRSTDFLCRPTAAIAGE